VTSIFNSYRGDGSESINHLPADGFEFWYETSEGAFSVIDPPATSCVDLVCGFHEKLFETGIVKSVIVLRYVFPLALSEVVASEEENTRLFIRTMLSAAEALATKDVTYCEMY